ncbi:hypothetical protein PUN28_005945 [Cardiocondyla obscurior]|uniref:Uncharacterized protein n=1 Tax=Cardiocondyla obscurior TaxID=286306 RepID=A0AAW2G9A3_9HYME
MQTPTDRRQTVAVVLRCARWSYRSLKIITSVTRSIDQKSSNYGGKKKKKNWIRIYSTYEKIMTNCNSVNKSRKNKFEKGNNIRLTNIPTKINKRIFQSVFN